MSDSTSDVKIVAVYDGIEIEYKERENKWNFELRGRERNADSLKQAKEIIDKPDPIKKTPFNKTRAYRSGLFDKDSFKLVTVTSIAEYDRRTPYFWVTDETGNRRKESASNIYAHTAVNASLIQDYKHISDKIKNLDEERSILVQQMTHLEVPGE